MLPNPMTAGQRDWQDRSPEGPGESKRSRLEVNLDAEDAALGKDNQALAARQDVRRLATEATVAGSPLLRADFHLLGVSQEPPDVAQPNSSSLATKRRSSGS